MSASRSTAHTAMLVASPVVGWFSLVFLPGILTAEQGLAVVASVALVFGTAGAAAFAIGYLQPSLWHVLGLVFAAPAVILGVIQINQERSNLWPIALASLGELLILVLALAFAGRALRTYRSRGTSSEVTQGRVNRRGN